MAEERYRVNDLESIDIRNLHWEDIDSSVQSVQHLYSVVHEKASMANAWYMGKRRGRKRIAQWLRGLAVLFAAGGFLPPVLALVWTDVPSELGYVLFVGAGSCLLINRSLGISSGWIRYITTAFAITAALEEFQLDWAQTMARFGEKKLDIDDINLLLGKIRSFARKINGIIESETATWATQFNEDLYQLERIVQRRTEAIEAP